MEPADDFPIGRLISVIWEVFENLSNFLVLQRCKSTSSNNASISDFKIAFLNATLVLTKWLQHTWWPCHLQILKWPGTWFLHLSKSLPWWRSYMTITKSQSSCCDFEICQSWGLQLIFEHYAITTRWPSMMLLDFENRIFFYFAKWLLPLFSKSSNTKWNEYTKLDLTKLVNRIKKNFFEICNIEHENVKSCIFLKFQAFLSKTVLLACWLYDY